MTPSNKWMRALVPVALTVASLALAHSYAAQEPTVRMEQIAQSYVDSKQFMGSVLVAKDGKINFLQGKYLQAAGHERLRL
jgi:hypothetical protein